LKFDILTPISKPGIIVVDEPSCIAVVVLDAFAGFPLLMVGTFCVEVDGFDVDDNVSDEEGDDDEINGSVDDAVDISSLPVEP